MNGSADGRLFTSILSFIEENGIGDSGRLLNIGANQSLDVESQLPKKGFSCKVDRIDIDDCLVEHPNVGECHVCSVESMNDIPSNAYDLAFSRWVLEHVDDLDRAASEVARVLKPGGMFISSIPNPTALEYRVAKATPLWFHKLVRGGTGWHTLYRYRNVADLSRIFRPAGLELTDSMYYPSVRTYLDRFPVAKPFGTAYDYLVFISQCRSLMGHVCVTFTKTG
jgi:SAM-dependent methyltransferase